jgi:two-component system, NarL family, sensor histidine kinase UhpB
MVGSMLRTLFPMARALWAWPTRACRLVLIGWVAALFTFSGQAHAQSVLIDRVVAVDAEPNADRFPVGAAQRSVTLPDEWSTTRGMRQTDVWYRATFDQPDNLQGASATVLIERACNNALVLLNGDVVHRQGSMKPPVARRCRHPIAITVPAAALKAQGNVLDIRLAGHALQEVASDDRAALLSAIKVGPTEMLQPQARTLAWWGHEAAFVTSLIYVALGMLLLVLGRVDRHESHLSSFGWVLMCLALFEARHWWADLPLSNVAVESVIVALLPVLAMGWVQFFLRYAGLRSRPIEFALWAQCFIVPVSVLMAGPSRLNVLASSWAVLLVIEVMVAACIYLWAVWHRQRSQFYVMTVLVGLGVLFTLWRLMIQQDRGAEVPQGLLQAGSLAVGVALSLRLVQQFGREFQVSEASRRMTEIRVREATLEIEKNFSQLAELRVEQVTAQERKRIAGDLHDDLGAKLLTIVHTSDDERISSLAREALEEMRLSVRGLTGKPVKLVDALGDWRAEFVQRLSQTGLEADWESPEDEQVPQRLSARAYVQTTRILREAVNNIIKHSGASRCGVTVRLIGSDFELAIQDNGKGMPTEPDGRLDRGHGMASMKQRAKQLHGQCLVESAPGSGTVIRLTLPLDRQLEPA